MSLKNLLPDGTYDEIIKESGIEPEQTQGAVLKVACPTCKKELVYSSANPFRPFCSERCKLIDLGAWANDEIKLKGKDALEDEDADQIVDPNLPRL